MRSARLLAFAAVSIVALAGCPRPPCDLCIVDDNPRVDASDVPRIDVSDVPTDRDTRDARDVALDIATDAPVTACALDATYSWDYEGGLAVSTDQSAVAPEQSYTRRRTFSDGTTAPIECSVSLPTCVAAGDDAGDAIRVDDVIAAVNNPDVQAALAPPADGGDLVVYGVDSRAADGQVFAFRAADGRGFYVGDPCMGAPACRDVPDGLAVLEGLLVALDRQQLADPSCAMLR